MNDDREGRRFDAATSCECDQICCPCAPCPLPSPLALVCRGHHADAPLQDGRPRRQPRHERQEQPAAQQRHGVVHGDGAGDGPAAARDRDGRRLLLRRAAAGRRGLRLLGALRPAAADARVPAPRRPRARGLAAAHRAAAAADGGVQRAAARGGPARAPQRRHPAVVARRQRRARLRRRPLGGGAALPRHALRLGEEAAAPRADGAGGGAARALRRALPAGARADGRRVGHRRLALAAAR